MAKQDAYNITPGLTGLSGMSGMLAKKTTSFNPLTLSPSVWLDASISANVTLNGSNVTGMIDLSGHGHPAIQATMAKQPTYVTGIQNGLNCVLFNGTSTNMVSTLSISTPATVYMAAKLFSLPSGTGYLCTSTTEGVAISCGPSGKWIAGGGISSTITADTNFHAFGCVCTSGVLTFLQVDETVGSTGSNFSDTSTTLTLGSNPSNASWGNMLFGELFIVQGATSINSSAMAYLKKKWGTP